MQSENTIRSLIDEGQWRGGWYQDITLPDGERTISTTLDFDKSPSRSLKKWELIEPYVTGRRFLDIGCNAGGYLVRAAEYYNELYGIDSSPHFLKQCRYVLDCFNVKARLFCSLALDFDFTRIPFIDTTIMVNTLYWIAYSDEKGYVENAEARMHSFMGALSQKTNDLILVGCENTDRIGGKLGITTAFIGEYFDIIDNGLAPFPDRMLNYIYATSGNRKNYSKAA